MHRVRTWARAKAHGPAPLISEPRRSSTSARNDARAGAGVAGRTLSPRSPAGAGRTAVLGDPTGALPPARIEDELGTALPEKEASERENVAVRFYLTVKDILFSSWINLLLVFVPVGIAVKFAGLSAGLVFAMNAIAIIPLAGLLSHATESVASRLGDTIGALMNVTFGNAVELIIFIALVKNEIRIVQASLLGSILANLLLILGMCFLLGGLRFREQIYNSTVTQMSACLLSLSVTSLLLPTAFHASFSNSSTADEKVLQVSRGTSVILLLVYGLYLLFQLNSHAYMYESTPQHIIERESVPGPAASYFNSSSSSESSSSSSSESDDSTHSMSTAKRIKRAMKGKRGGKPSSTSQQPVDTETPSMAAPMSASSLVEGSNAEQIDIVRVVQPNADPTATAEDGMEEADEATSKRKTERKHRKHKKTKRVREESTVAPDQVAIEPASGQNAEGTKRVDFALAPNVEAQTDPRTKPFSLRSIRPNFPTTLSQNVFAAPPQGPIRNGAAGRPYSMRRANSMPVDDRAYRTPPGAVPPIVPIVVNTKPKTHVGDENEHQELNISRTTAVLLLLCSTALVALCAEFMVGSINDVVADGSGISEAFIGLIFLPIVGNAAEHVTAVTVALKNKMDLAIGVAVGSSIQIALFVTPLVVILGWIMNKQMSLFFTLFETVSMFVSAFIVNFLVLDGRSNYLEGALLCSAYVIIAVAAFFYPNAEEANDLGGGGTNDTAEAVVEGARLLVREAVRLIA